MAKKHKHEPASGQSSRSTRPAHKNALSTQTKILLDLFAARDYSGLAMAAQEAAAAYPSHAFFWKALGIARGLLGERGDSVIGPLTEALRWQPDDAEVFDGQAQALARVGRMEEALAASARAVALAPNHAVMQSNFGNLLADQQRFGEAFARLRLAVQLAPKLAVGWLNLGNALRAIPWCHGEAQSALVQAITLDPHLQAAWDNLLYLRQYQSEPLARDIVRESLVAAELLTHSRPPRTRPAARQLEDRPLRVGWVSADLRDHPVGSALLAVLPYFDKRRVEIVVYSNSTIRDLVTEQISSFVSGWREVSGLSDEAVADCVSTDGIDVLVDLSGRTRGHRLGVFAGRAAPVQVCWLGWFATSGLPQMDWYLGDSVTLPDAEASQFVERRWVTDGLYYVQSARTLDVATDTRASDSAIRFGCFNSLAKLSTRTLELWAKILIALPDATLFLKSRELADADVCAGLRQEFTRRGIAGHRLRLAANSPLAEYLAAFNEVDVSLDPTPYTGGATSFDSLWMGVPVLTLAGDRFIAHQGETILRRVNLMDWVVASESAYVARAVEAATDLARLRSGRHALRECFLSSSLVDGAALAVQLADAWHGMHAAVLAGPPDPLLPEDSVAREKVISILRRLDG